MILVIDDLRSFPFEARYARTSDEGLHILENWEWDENDEIWLDHDLGVSIGPDGASQGPAEIWPCVDYLRLRAIIGPPLTVGRIVVHTSNPYGGDMIVRSLRDLYKVDRVSAYDHGAMVT